MSGLDYGAYLDAVNQLMAEPERLCAELESAAHAGEDAHRAASTAHRHARDTWRDLDSRLQRTRTQASVLASRSGLLRREAPAPSSAPTDRMDVERALRAAATDLQHAESSWQWAERARRELIARPAPDAPTRAGAAVTAPSLDADAPPSTRREVRWWWWAAAGLVAVAGSVAAVVAAIH